MSAVYYLVLIALVALAATFAIQVIEKWGYRDRIIDCTHGLIQQMFQCDFCLGFWTSMLFSIILAFALGYWYIIAVPVFTAPLIRYLLN